ncbi:LysM peptidoglycan-binding domain-containing protein [Melittangium boletus]|uniref:LysM peptidoglycan-binding domain-containing protein n=1 Tax=Melittangium boletus TaxID=83453 RepID=UPI003DA69EC7
MALHTIRRGDTLSALAKKFNTSVGALAKVNGIKNPDRIIAGRKLEIPGSRDSFEARPTGGAGRAPAAGRTPAAGGAGRAPAAGGATGAAPVAAPGNAAPGKGVTSAQLRQIMPTLSQAKADQYLPHINRAMSEAGINTPKRQAAFLAQLGHESGGLRYMEEIASGAAYEGRRDLGNTQPGDGTRFKGRGPIQLTGRANYRAAGKALGLDLENNPRQAASPEVGFRTAAWFWNSRNLNSLADKGDFRGITKRVNGGYNGLADREAYYRRALNTLR